MPDASGRRVCGPDLTVLPHKAAFPVSLGKWRHLLDPTRTWYVEFVSNKSFAIQLWKNMQEKRSKGQRGTYKEASALMRLMRRNCPATAQVRMGEVVV